jgi:hypothetical protein
MKITITDNISLLRRITTIINSSLIIDFRTHIRYVTQFYHMVISMKQDSHAGRIIDVTFRDAVTHTIHPYSGTIGFLNPVIIMYPAILHIVSGRGQ